jgi:type VII secretion integral membrane protein EccD
MADDRCRVTVIGDRKQLDVALPAWAPVGEYISRLVTACEVLTDDVLPEAWSLAPAGARPVPLAGSLAEAGVVDGQRLYLRDIAAGETDEPIVDDVGEIVSDHTDRGRLRGVARAAAAAALGLGWLLAAAVCLLVVRSPQPDTGAASSLVGVGLLLPMAVWLLGRRPTAVPGPLRLAAALTAIPCLAAAGALLASSAGSGRLSPVAALFGAALGALLAMAAVPHGVTLAVQLLLGLAAAEAVALAAFHAGPGQVAAVVCVTGLVVLARAPWAAAALAGTSFGALPVARWSPESVGDMVVRTRGLLGVLTAVAAVAVAVAATELAGSADLFALLLAVVTAAALLVRAADSALAVQAVPLGITGLAGMFAALVLAPARLHAGGWLAPVLVSVGVAVVAAGFCAAVTSATRPDAAYDRLGPDLDHHSWLEVVGLLCNLATVPLLLGLFGVFHQLMLLGRQL